MFCAAETHNEYKLNRYFKTFIEEIIKENDTLKHKKIHMFRLTKINIYIIYIVKLLLEEEY